MAFGEFRRRCRVTRWCSISDSDSELVELELEDEDELEEELELDMSKYLSKTSFQKWFPYWKFGSKVNSLQDRVVKKI